MDKKGKRHEFCPVARSSVAWLGRASGSWPCWCWMRCPRWRYRWVVGFRKLDFLWTCGYLYLSVFRMCFFCKENHEAFEQQESWIQCWAALNWLYSVQHQTGAWLAPGPKSLVVLSLFWWWFIIARVTRSPTCSMVGTCYSAVDALKLELFGICCDVIW